MAVTLFFYYLPPYFKALENYLLSIWNSYFPETSSIFSNLLSLSNTNRTEGHDDIRLRGNAITIFFYHFFPKDIFLYFLSIIFSSIAMCFYNLQGILTAIGFIPSGLMFKLTIPDLFVLRNTISPRPFQVIILLSV